MPASLSLPMNRIEIRPLEEGDGASVLAGWNRIFPDQDGLEPRGPEDFDWAFRSNPTGPMEAAVAVLDGEIVGQYACLPMRSLREGEEISTGLVVDAFVLPPHRRALGRPGLIIHLARKLHEWYCGPGAALRERGHDLLYGYPYPIWRIARRYLDSEMVRDMDVLFREIRTEPKRLPEGVSLTGAVPEDADDLWSRLAGEIRFGLVRDRAYLKWRYEEHPRNRYSFLSFRDDAGSLRALAVARAGRYVVERAGLLVDWIAPREEEPCEAALLAGLETWAAKEGLPLLLCVLPQNDPRFLRFQRRGFLVGPPSHFLVMNSFRDHVRWLRDRWFFTLGDSDLV